MALCMCDEKYVSMYDPQILSEYRVQVLEWLLQGCVILK